MRLRKQQTGLGALGWLIVLAIGAFVLTSLFKIGPIYIEYWQTKSALDLVVGNEKSSGLSRDQLLDAIQRQFDVSEIESISAKDIKFIDTKNGRELNANYEKRIPFIDNIDVVVKFDHLIYKLSPAE